MIATVSRSSVTTGAPSRSSSRRAASCSTISHYAVEAEAKIDDGFWGLLARGTTLAELSDRTMENPISPGLVLAERLVGPMQSVWNERLGARRNFAT